MDVSGQNRESFGQHRDFSVSIGQHRDGREDSMRRSAVDAMALHAPASLSGDGTCHMGIAVWVDLRVKRGRERERASEREKEGAIDKTGYGPFEIRRGQA